MESSRRISKALTNVSVRYKNDSFIANDILRDVMVVNKSDQYYVYSNDFRIEETRRANKAPSGQVTWTNSLSSYSLDVHSLHDIITEQDIRNTETPLQAEADSTEYITEKIQLRMEKDAADLLFTTTSFSNNTTIATATTWKNTTTSAPIQNVLSATAKIKASGGGTPNEAATNLNVIHALKENANIYERIQYVERAILTPMLLASLFDLSKIHVGDAVYNANKEGQAQSLTNLWGDDFLMGNFAKRPGLKTRTTAAMLRWSLYKKPWQVKRWRDEDRDGTKIEVTTGYVPKLIATASGYLFKAVTTSS